MRSVVLGVLVSALLWVEAAALAKPTVTGQLTVECAVTNAKVRCVVRTLVDPSFGGASGEARRTVELTWRELVPRRDRQGRLVMRRLAGGRDRLSPSKSAATGFVVPLPRVGVATELEVALRGRDGRVFGSERFYLSAVPDGIRVERNHPAVLAEPTRDHAVSFVRPDDAAARE